MENEFKIINNNEYGAAELKNTYQKNFLKGLEIAVIFHVILLSGYLFIYRTGLLNAEEHTQKVLIKREIDIKDIIPPPINENEEPLKVEDIVKPLKDPASLEPEPVAQKIAEMQTTRTQNELENITSNVSREGDSLIAGNFIDENIVDNTTIDKNINKDNDKPVKDVFNEYEVEVAPECINLNNIKHSIIYPQVAKEAGIEGNVTVKVLVGTDGNVIKVGSITGPDIFHDEVREKAKELVFTPGLQNNKPVKVWVHVPFSFKLQN